MAISQPASTITPAGICVYAFGAIDFMQVPAGPAAGLIVARGARDGQAWILVYTNVCCR
jgi:hypothetical protein